LALEVLADILQHSTMPEDEIERERDVILQEIGMCHDTPDDVIFDNYYEAAYPKQSLGAPILGTVETIRSLKRETLMAYVARYYTPSRMVICAAGNVSHDSFVQQVAAEFGDLPQDHAERYVPAAYAGGENRTEKDLEQSHVVLGFQGVGRLEEEYYAAQVLSTLLGGGMSSRLFQEVREKRGLVYSIFSFHSAYMDDGQFGIYAGTGPDKLKELVPVVCDEIMGLAGKVTESEIERAKAQLRAASLMSLESMMSRADQGAKSLVMRGYIRSTEEIISAINAVDMKRIESIAQRIFTSKPTLAGLGPLAELESFDGIKRRLAA
jgi:predicted Zn-dependent peptidase